MLNKAPGNKKRNEQNWGHSNGWARSGKHPLVDNSLDSHDFFSRNCFGTVKKKQLLIAL